jgi:hypothetical protein
VKSDLSNAHEQWTPVAQTLEFQMKKKALVIGGIAAAALLAGGWAFAQSTGHGPGGMRGMGPGMHGHMGPGMHGPMGAGMHGQMGLGMHGQMGPGMHGQMGPGSAFVDPAGLDRLKTELGVTAAQETAWTKYAKAVQDATTTMKTTRESVNPETVSKLSPADRFAFVTKVREQAQKQFEAIKTAADELLSTLDDTQKAKAKEILPGLAFGPGITRGATLGGPHHRH